MLRILSGAALALILTDLALAAEVYRCAVPPGLQVESDRRFELRIAGLPEKPAEGWYEQLPAPISADYRADMPILLDLSRTPYFLGWINGGRAFGDQADRQSACGHSLEAFEWSVLVEAYGDGFATFDMRAAIDEQPLPTEPGEHALAAHAFEFEIAGTAYTYVAAQMDVGLVKVWRPDMTELSERYGLPGKRRSRDAEAIWQVLDRFGGPLLAADLPPQRWQETEAAPVREFAALEPARGGGGAVLFFDSGDQEQPVDLTGTPYAYGGHYGVEAAHPGEPDPEAPFVMIPGGETMTFHRRGGAPVEVHLSGWFDRQVAEIGASNGFPNLAIADPLIVFEYEGEAVKFVVSMLWARAVDAGDGKARFEVNRIIGDLFAAAPLERSAAR